MLKNELYNGKQIWQWKKKLPNKQFKYLGKPVEVRVPQIIDDKTFKIVQNKINEITSLRIRNSTIRENTLLSGLLKCDKCKLQLSHRYREDIGYGNHYYGRCKEHQWRKNEQKISKDECSIQRSLRIEETDELVLKSLIDLIKKSSNIREEYRTELLNQKEQDLTISKVKSLKIRKKIKSITNHIGSIEDKIAPTTVQITTKEISKSLGNKIVKLSGQDILKKREEIVELERGFLVLKDSSKFIDWIDIMSKDILSIKSKPRQFQREWVRKFVKNILVEYDTNTKSHKLKINFFIGLINDNFKRTGRDKNNNFQFMRL